MSSSSRPQSVRGLYTPPAEEWVFLPPTVSPPTTSANSSPPPHIPSFAPEADNDVDLALSSPLALIASNFFITAVGLPFEVGKTLLQVEYRPRARFAPPEAEVKKDWGAEDDNLSNPDEADVYFSDRLEAPSQSFTPPPPPKADASGYLSDPTPSYQIKDDPDISRGNGVWGMIRRIRATPSEGLPALWKSQLVGTAHSVLYNVLQPRITSLVFALGPAITGNGPLPLDFPLTALPSPGIPLALQVASHAITSLILSPLELIQTRLIVWASAHPTTPSSVTILRRAIADEGGISGLYTASNLLIPAVMELTLRPLLTLSIPLVLERWLGVSPDLSPITYSLAELGLNIASLILILPIETVRRRLQLQSRAPGGGKHYRSVVRLRDRDYVGMAEAVWRIISEETSAPRKRKMTYTDEGGFFSGVGQLYRGFGMMVTANFTMFGLKMVTLGLGGNMAGLSAGGLNTGWKEI